MFSSYLKNYVISMTIPQSTSVCLSKNQLPTSWIYHDFLKTNDVKYEKLLGQKCFCLFDLTLPSFSLSSLLCGQNFWNFIISIASIIFWNSLEKIGKFHKEISDFLNLDIWIFSKKNWKLNSSANKIVFYIKGQHWLRYWESKKKI